MHDATLAAVIAAEDLLGQGHGHDLTGAINPKNREISP
jgi:hypothetical protein